MNIGIIKSYACASQKKESVLPYLVESKIISNIKALSISDESKRSMIDRLIDITPIELNVVVELTGNNLIKRLLR